jgi:hypothetical protein
MNAGADESALRHWSDQSGVTLTFPLVQKIGQIKENAVVSESVIIPQTPLERVLYRC